MPTSLDVISGFQAGETFVLPTGKRLKVGRGAQADIYLSADPLASDVHCVVWSDHKACYLEDLGGRGGTLLNGRKVLRQGALKHGDEIVAGITHFRVRITDPMPASGPHGALLPEERVSNQTPLQPSGASASRDVQGVVQILAAEAQQLFAILDAARDSQVVEWLNASEQEHQSLYEGARGQELADSAPYLVRLSPDPRALATLVRASWGRGWGIFLTSPASFQEVRRHLRRLLIVRTEDRKTLYFRFYDPLTLRDFLSTCTPAEASQVFGPITAYWTEDGCGKVIRQLTLQNSKLCERTRVSRAESLLEINRPNPRSSTRTYEARHSALQNGHLPDSRSPGISIEPLAPRHTRALHALLIDLGDKEGSAFLGAEPSGYLETASRQQDHTRPSQFPFTVFADDVIAGLCTLRQVDLDIRTATLGFWIGLPFRRRGLATVAVREVIAFGFASLDLRIIRAVSDSRNHVAHRVLQRACMPRIRHLRPPAGHPLSGVRVDYHVITLDQWQSSTYDYDKSAAIGDIARTVR